MHHCMEAVEYLKTVEHMATSSAYYSNEEEVIQRSALATVSELHSVPEDRISDVYEIERCLIYIKEHRCKKVALQFPDSLLVDATKVAWQLGRKCDAKIYIMADTSYGHCDIDEVNAKHVDADLIIHYGESALTQSATIPTLHVFGQHSSRISCEEVKMAFREVFPVKETTRIIFLHHVMCRSAANEISESLIKEYLYLSIGQLNIPTDPGGTNFKGNKADDGSILKDLCTKSCPGCTCRMEDEEPQKSNGSVSDSDVSSSTYSINSPESQTDTSHQPDCKDYVTGFYTIPLETDKIISDYAIFYLGPKNCQSLENFLLSHPLCEVHVYDPDTGYELLHSKVNRHLMKRYYLVEKAKDAKIVGILVGTMGVAGYQDCLSYMKNIAKFAGKKIYTFIMGKLTPEKLANFLEIDVYVLIANPEHSILDSSNFYRPVVTPYEFDVACNPNREWSASYITDFREILPGAAKYVELPAINDGEVTVSLITGGIRTAIEIEDNVQPSSKLDIALRNDKTDIAVFGNHSSVRRLSERTWKGLEQNIGKTPVSKAKEGRSGVATSYNELMDF